MSFDVISSLQSLPRRLSIRCLTLFAVLSVFGAWNSPTYAQEATTPPVSAEAPHIESADGSHVIGEAEHEKIYGAIHAAYTEQADIRHGAARGWVDRIIEPHRTREELIAALEATSGWDYSKTFRTGVLQT